jgi:hypothetical protein
MLDATVHEIPSSKSSNWSQRPEHKSPMHQRTGNWPATECAKPPPRSSAGMDSYGLK